MTATKKILGTMAALTIAASTNAQSAVSPTAAATKRVLAQQDGSVILVGNSYGGSINNIGRCLQHQADRRRLAG